MELGLYQMADKELQVVWVVLCIRTFQQSCSEGSALVLACFDFARYTIPVRFSKIILNASRDVSFLSVP